jgi:dTDP-4-dehydrorhamnose 3,5-epimerase-like enzyme
MSMPMNTTVHDCRLINLPNIQSDRKGSLTYIYNDVHLPFAVQRVYYLYDVPAGSVRGGHAHRDLLQLIVAVSGSFDVVVNDGRESKTFTLNRPSYGLFVPRLIWRELVNFSGGSISLVLASTPYDEQDYFREFDRFVQHKETIR